MAAKSACRVAALVAVLVHGAATAQSDAPPASLPTFAELEAQAAVIGRIVVRPEQIFDLDDPRENRFLYRLANRLHVRTRPEVIERQLLFKPGDFVSLRVINETERVLRANSYLQDVQIRPLDYRDGVVDIEVTTRDTWTLQPAISAARVGGVNSYRASIRDRNVAGSGASVGLSYSSNVDRAGTELSYQDNNLFGTHTALAATLANLTDGEQWAFSLAQPFYSLDTRRAGGIAASHGDVVTNLYEQGVRVAQYRTVSDAWDGYAGWSAGRIGSWSQRYSAGVSHSATSYLVNEGDLPAPRLPPEVILTGPYLRYEAIEDVFEKVQNRNQIGKAEFFAMGLQGRMQLGYSLGGLGSTENSWLYAASASKGFGAARGRALLVNVGVSGRLNDRTVRNQLFSGAARYYLPQGPNALFIMALSGDSYRNPDVPAPLQIGGDTGLRGYPLSFQSGDRRALLTFEERVYTEWHPYRLFRVGGAVFFDAGRAWGGTPDATPLPGTQSPENRALGTLTDWGFGLRVADSRSSYGSVLHADLAFPLNARDQVRSVQFILKSQTSF